MSKAITRQIERVFDAHSRGDYDGALLCACIAVDATAKKLYPSIISSRQRYVKCLRSYYWLLEPMMGVGVNLEETLFNNIKLKSGKPADFAEVVYEVFRCNHVHGEEVPLEFELTPFTLGESLWKIGPNLLQMPARLVWALAAVAVFSRVNTGLKNSGNEHLGLGDDE